MKTHTKPECDYCGETQHLATKLAVSPKGIPDIFPQLICRKCMHHGSQNGWSFLTVKVTIC